MSSNPECFFGVTFEDKNVAINIFQGPLFIYYICLDIFRFMTRLDVFKNAVGSISWGADTSAPQRQISALSAPQRQFAGGRHVCSPTPGSRPVGAPMQICSIPGLHGSRLFGMDSLSRGAPTPIFWGADIRKFMG